MFNESCHLVFAFLVSILAVDLVIHVTLETSPGCITWAVLFITLWLFRLFQDISGFPNPVHTISLCTGTLRILMLVDLEFKCSECSVRSV